MRLESKHMTDIPKLLYKYKSVTTRDDLIRLLDIFEKDRLYIPTYSCLNDPLEGNIVDIGLDDYAGISIPFYADQEDPIVKAEKEKYHILSMSANGKDPLMWAHYADNYSGICLCYRTDKTFSKLLPVVYVTGRIFRNTINGTKLADAVEESFYYKHQEWQYEKEWRYIEKGRDEIPHYFQFQKNELVGVIFGHNIDREVLQFLRDNLPTRTKSLETYIGYRSFQIHTLPEGYQIQFDGSTPEYKDNLEEYFLEENPKVMKKKTSTHV